MSDEVTFFSPGADDTLEVVVPLDQAPTVINLLGYTDIGFYEGDLDGKTFLSRVEYAEENLTTATPDWVWGITESLRQLAQEASSNDADVLWE